MRKITERVCRAFESGERFASGNSHTDGKSLYLHGNEIARHSQDGMMITNAGWPSMTTKERLNGLRGVHIKQKSGVWFLNGKEWDGSWTTVSNHA